MQPGRIEKLVIKAEKKAKALKEAPKEGNPYVPLLVTECERIIKILESR